MPWIDCTDPQSIPPPIRYAVTFCLFFISRMTSGCSGSLTCKPTSRRLSQDSVWKLACKLTKSSARHRLPFGRPHGVYWHWEGDLYSLVSISGELMCASRRHSKKAGQPDDNRSQRVSVCAKQGSCPETYRSISLLVCSHFFICKECGIQLFTDCLLIHASSYEDNLLSAVAKVRVIVKVWQNHSALAQVSRPVRVWHDSPPAPQGISLLCGLVMVYTHKGCSKGRRQSDQWYGSHQWLMLTFSEACTLPYLCLSHAHNCLRMVRWSADICQA